MTTDVIILAAGKGTRMRSTLPKPLQPLMGKPIIHYALESAAPLVKDQPVIVLGHGAEQIRLALGDTPRYVEQIELLGTGHAVSQAESLLSGKSDLVLITYVDMPLVRSQTLQQLIDTQKLHSGPMTILTVHEEDPRGFGRVIRNSEGQIQAIVEEADATPEQLEITELNAGMYCFKSEWLWENLKSLDLSPKGEYYLTDLVFLATQQGLSVDAVLAEDKEELIGINTRVHLAEAGKILRKRINTKLMLSGVSLVDPESVYIESDVDIGQDTLILPNTYLQGKTSIGNNCIIGPDTRIFSSQVGDSCEIEFSVIEQSKIENGVDIGPFSHLRKGAHIGSGVHIGTSVMGPKLVIFLTWETPKLART